MYIFLIHSFCLHSRRAAKPHPQPLPKGEGSFGTPLLLLLSKNMLSHFLNSDFVGTEPKEAAYPVTVLISKQGVAF